MGMVILLVAIFVIMCLGFAAILSKFDIISDYLDDFTEGDHWNVDTSKHNSPDRNSDKNRKRR